MRARGTWESALLIHAGKRYDPAGEQFIRDLGIELPDELELGGIIGEVQVVGCVRDSPSPWAFAGSFHWQLAGARPLPFTALRGRQTLFRVR